MLIVYVLIAALALAFMAVLAMFALNRRPRVDLTQEQVAGILEGFVRGTRPRSEWDDFLFFQMANPALEAIAARCRQLPEEFPPEGPNEYTNTKGVAVLNQYIRQLREQSQPRKGAEPLGARL